MIHVNGSPRILVCRDQQTALMEESLDELVEQYMLEGCIVLPRPHMRCYRFYHEEKGGQVPRMVMLANSVKVGVVSPLHPLIQDVCKKYHLAPTQINRNMYRSMVTRTNTWLFSTSSTIHRDSPPSTPKHLAIFFS